MSNRLRPRTLALLVSLALAQWGLADRARAEDTPALGNGLQLAPVNPSTAGAWLAEDGMGTREPAARTPSGRFFDIPLAPVEMEGLKVSEGGWRTFGFVEFGAIGVDGDEGAQGFRAYKDIQSGPTIQSFGAFAEKPESARYMEVVGGSVGRNDEFYGLRLGRYNDWKLEVYYNETPHVYTTTYRSLWSGVGTDRLALDQGLPPGGGASAAATQTAVRNALAVTENGELGVTRKKAGMRLDMNLTETWKFHTSYSEERRQGARPFGAVFGTGTNMEIPESIDYTTRDLAAGAHYRDDVNRFNVQATASVFRNNVDTLTFDNPLFAAPTGTAGLTANTFTHGRFDLTPGNEHYHLKGEYGRLIPSFYKANFTATAAFGTMRQDDQLIPPSPFALTGGTVQGVSLANNWNTTAALPRPSAEARIDTRLADLGFSLKPTDALTVKASLRYYETVNHTEYWACNPLTGQWGRLLLDGSNVSIAGANTMAGVNPVGTLQTAYNAAGCNADAVRALNLVPAAGNIVIGSAPSDYQQMNGGVSADYRLGRTSSLNAALERETYKRDHREREETWEDKVKLGYVNRGMLDGTLRVSVEYGQRRGSDFDTDPYAPYLSRSFGPDPTTNGVNMTSWLRGVTQLQQYDLADRDQGILNARMNHLFTPNFEGAMTLQWKDAQYPAEVGRGRQQQGSIGFDFDYKASSKFVLYGYYAYQAGTMEQRGVQGYACAMGTTYHFYSNGQVLPSTTPAPAGTTLVSTQTVTTGNWESVCGSASATSPLFPDSRGWEVTSKDRNDTLGVGAKADFGRAKVDANFTRSLARTRIGYTYNAAALGISPAQQALVGDGFSDLRFAQNVFTLSVLMPIDKQMSLRLYERYERGSVSDWHYDGVASNPMPSTGSLYLDAGPQDYSVNVIGVLLLIRL
ncbi:MAG TPA: MtrB/PioB family outer membrane beta-barrel protein [Burkholderiales bacterium]|nr:MtrB/PioB family outer membrane beta-barrel protein [Burkholderiales bacterium]